MMLAVGWPFINILPLSATQRFLPRFKSEDTLRKLHCMVPWAQFCLYHIFKAAMDVEGTDYIPRPSRGYMYVSNHQSYLDILVLIAVLETVAFLAKDSVQDIPLLGRAAYAGGTIFVDRKSREDRQRALDETVRMCKESTAVVVFPEGTVSDNGDLRDKVYLSSLVRAYEAGLILVPIGIHGSMDLLPNTLDRINVGTPVSVRIGMPLSPGEFQSGDEMATECWERVSALHGLALAAVRAARCGAAVGRDRRS